MAHELVSAAPEVDSEMDFVNTTDDHFCDWVDRDMEVINTTDDKFLDWVWVVEDEVDSAQPSFDCGTGSSAAASFGDPWSRPISDTSSAWKSPPLGDHDDRKEGARSDSLDSSTAETSMAQECISDPSLAWKSQPLGEHDDQKDGARSDSPDSDTSTQEDTDSDSDAETMPSGGASEQNDFLDLEDIFAIDVPRHKASEYSSVELEASLAIEDLKNAAINGHAFTQEIVDPVQTPAAHRAIEQHQNRRYTWSSQMINLLPQQKDAEGANHVLSVARATTKRSDRAAQLEAKRQQIEKRHRDDPPPKKSFASNRQKLLELADDLNAAFCLPEFQRRLYRVLAEARRKQYLPPGAPLGFVQGRQDLVRSVHSQILPVYGYGSYGNELGYHSMLLAMEPYCFDNALLERLAATDRLLGLPPNSTIYDLLDTSEKFLPVIGLDDVD